MKYVLVALAGIIVGAGSICFRPVLGYYNSLDRWESKMQDLRTKQAMARNKWVILDRVANNIDPSCPPLSGWKEVELGRLGDPFALKIDSLARIYFDEDHQLGLSIDSLEKLKP